MRKKNENQRSLVNIYSSFWSIWTINTKWIAWLNVNRWICMCRDEFELFWNFMIMISRQNLQIFEPFVVFFWTSTCTATENKNLLQSTINSSPRQITYPYERPHSHEPRFAIPDTPPIDPTMFLRISAERIQINVQPFFLAQPNVID